MKKINILVVEWNLQKENDNFRNYGIQTHADSLKDSIGYYEKDLNIPNKLSEVVEENKINLDKLSQMALEDPSTITNPKKLTIDDMKILYQHSISGKLF